MMIKIRLFCALGFSTGMLVKKMEEVAASNNIEVDIKACPQGSFADNIHDADVALLGPQLGYTLQKSRMQCDQIGIPVDVIPMQDYGLMNGKGVLDFALNLIKNYQK